MSTSATFRPTTTCTLLRTPQGVVDEYGDPVDDDTEVAVGVPVSILQQGVRQFLPAEGRYTNVTTYTARLRGDVDVRERDRVRDERTGAVYMVEGIVQPQDPHGVAAIRLDLRKVGPTLS